MARWRTHSLGLGDRENEPRAQCRAALLLPSRVDAWRRSYLDLAPSQRTQNECGAVCELESVRSSRGWTVTTHTLARASAVKRVLACHALFCFPTPPSILFPSHTHDHSGSGFCWWSRTLQYIFKRCWSLRDGRQNYGPHERASEPTPEASRVERQLSSTVSLVLLRFSRHHISRTFVFSASPAPTGGDKGRSGNLKPRIAHRL